MKLLIIFLKLLLLRSIKPYNTIIREPKCMYMADVGACTENEQLTKVYGYDYFTNRCVHFFYNGCGGNPNRFATRQECMDQCFVEGADTADDDEDFELAEEYLKTEF